jgi:ribosomal protein S27AE
MSAFKQLVVKSLVQSDDLQLEILSFAFIDKTEFEQKQNTRLIKNSLVRDINRNLKYHRGAGGYWILSYKPYSISNIEIGGQICSRCGLFYASHNEQILINCVSCSCLL